MELDRRHCYRALKSRDPRFDGRFFVCVATTGIYCRPVCPARIPLAKNCSFVSSAAAAQQRGFRPCLRCRPECAPGAPAWRGTGAVAARALKLIADGALDEAGVDALAARTGLGARHLRRLVRVHAGASPVELARTRRILFAKRLIVDTSLKITDIAFASGFRSLRRFNAEMAAALGRAPRALRASRHKVLEPALVLPLVYRPPYDWDGVLAFLGARAIPGIETVADGTYTREFRLGPARGRFVISHVPARRALSARIEIDRLEMLDRLVARLRAMFDLDADPHGLNEFFRADPMIAPRLKAAPGLRVVQNFDVFEAGLRTIAGQQVSVKGAITLLGRIVARHGAEVLSDPAQFAALDLAGLGFTGARARTMVAWAEFARDTPALEALRFDLDGAVETLTALPGIGPWTAQYLCLRGLAHTDAFPAGDLVLRQAAGMTQAALEARAEAWRPFRAYAAQALWRVPHIERMPIERIGA